MRLGSHACGVRGLPRGPCQSGAGDRRPRLTAYAAILAAWDAEGYAKDRAMQEDLRGNSVVRLSARDRSSIDGLLHVSLTTECRVP